MCVSDKLSPLALLYCRCLSRALSAWLLVIVLGVPAAAQTVHRVDLRQNKDEQNAYYVMFCARKSQPWGPGHAFVVWIETEDQEHVVQIGGFGFYPEADEGLVRFFNGPGALVDESTKAASTNSGLITHRLVCRVDRATFARSLKVKRRWSATRHTYHILQRNCTHFAHEVAGSITLASPLPMRGERPPTYLGRMIGTARQRR